MGSTCRCWAAYEKTRSMYSFDIINKNNKQLWIQNRLAKLLKVLEVKHQNKSKRLNVSSVIRNKSDSSENGAHCFMFKNILRAGWWHIRHVNIYNFFKCLHVLSNMFFFRFNLHFYKVIVYLQPFDISLSWLILLCLLIYCILPFLPFLFLYACIAFCF